MAMSEKTYHHKDLRAALVLAGRDILESDGLSALTLRACARHAGVSHAAPAHHFGTVNSLLSAIAASGFEDFVEALEVGANTKSTAEERLFAMGVSYTRFAASHPALYRVMFGGEAGQDMSPNLMVAMSKAWNQLVGSVSDLTGQAGANGAAFHVWALVHGYSTLVASGLLPPMIDAENELNQMLNSTHRAISATV